MKEPIEMYILNALLESVCEWLLTLGLGARSQASISKGGWVSIEEGEPAPSFSIHKIII